MKLFFKIIVFLSCIMALPLISFARDTALPQTVDLGDNYTISLPSDWTVTTGSQGAFTVTSSDISLTILTPTYVNTLGLNLDQHSNVVTALIDIYALPPDGGTIGESDIQKVRYGDRTAAVYTHAIDNTTDGMDVVIAMSDGSPGYLAFAANKGKLIVHRPTVSGVIASFDGTGSASTEAAPSTNPGGDTSGHGLRGTTGTSTESSGGSSATGGASEVNCTVSTDQADGTQLRVGPGKNRGAISFLPTNIDVTVTGRIVLNDKSVWYQLDKAQAAPKGTAAAELWVAADSVTASGDCDHVGETTAPPVIPGNIAPPPATDGNGGDQGSANTTPGLLPAAGAWVLVMNATSNASCQGGDNFPYSTSETFDPTTYGDTIVGINNNSFYYSSDTFTRIAGTNSFTGTFTYSDGTPGFVRLNLVSATQMTGSITVNYDLQGHKCSETVQFVSNHG